MKDHKELKSVEYIDAMKRYVETAFGVRFKKTGANQYHARCPFHADIHPSFVLYPRKDTGEVRFHCCGECDTEWDIYDLIRLREKCGFKKAQQVWADYLGVKDFVPFGGDGSAPEPEPEQELDNTVEIVEPAELDQTIGEIVHLLENGRVEGPPGQLFKLPYSFLRYERHTELGPALILWLRIAIEQQARKRRIKATDDELAEWLNTSRMTISTYKRRLKNLGFLNIDNSKRPQKLSVWYRPKTRSDDGLHDAQRPARSISKQQPDSL